MIHSIWSIRKSIPIEHEFVGYRQDGDVAEDYQGNLYLILCDPGIHPIGSVCMEQSELDDAVKLENGKIIPGNFWKKFRSKSEITKQGIPCQTLTRNLNRKIGVNV
ncbi:MAG: hypothetical protein ACLRIL_01790 [Fusicatenibacter saccharivorans]